MVAVPLPAPVLRTVFALVGGARDNGATVPLQCAPQVHTAPVPPECTYTSGTAGPVRYDRPSAEKSGTIGFAPGGCGGCGGAPTAGADLHRQVVHIFSPSNIFTNLLELHCI